MLLNKQKQHFRIFFEQASNLILFSDQNQVGTRQNQIWSKFILMHKYLLQVYKHALNLILSDQNQIPIRHNQIWNIFCFWWTNIFFRKLTNRRQIWFSLIWIKFWSDRFKFESRFAFHEQMNLQFYKHASNQKIKFEACFEFN